MLTVHKGSAFCIKCTVALSYGAPAFLFATESETEGLKSYL